MLEKLKNYKMIFVAIFLLLCLTIGISMAMLKNQSNTLTNTFAPGSVETEIKEEDPKPNGSDIDKAPYVTNVGKNEALIRMRIMMSPSELIHQLDIQLVINDKDWTYNQDGYYYYNKLLKPNESTTPLFTKVTGKDIVVNGKLSNELAGLEISVYHESVQNLILDKDDNEIKASTGNDEQAHQIWNMFDALH